MTTCASIAADFDVLVDHHIRPDVRPFADLCRSMHHRRRVHARFIARRLGEEFEGMRECEVRVPAAQQGRGNGGEFLGDDHR
jgi:hypothetical protein